MSGDFDLALGETLRNLRSSIKRTTTIVVIAALVGYVVATLSLADIRNVSELVRQQFNAGSTAFQVVGPGGGRVSAIRCNAITSINGVLAAGGILATEPVQLASQPDETLNVVTVTPDFAAAAWPSFAGSHSSVIAGSYFRTLKWTSGTTVKLIRPSGVESVARIEAVPGAPSMVGLERSIVTTSPPRGEVDTCLVLASPENRSAVASALSGWFGDGTSVQDVLVPSALMTDPAQVLRSRPSSFGWLFGGAALMIVLLGVWISRRTEFALYRLLGSSEKFILGNFAIETFLLTLVPIQIGALASIGFRSIDVLTTQVFWLDWSRLDLFVLFIPIVGLALVPSRSLLLTLKGL